MRIRSRVYRYTLLFLTTCIGTFCFIEQNVQSVPVQRANRFCTAWRSRAWNKLFLTVARNSPSRKIREDWTVVLHLIKQVKITEITDQTGAPWKLLSRSTGLSVNTRMRKKKQLCIRYYFCCFFVHFTVIVAKPRTCVNWNGKLNSAVIAQPSAARLQFINPTVRFILMGTENPVDLHRIVIWDRSAASLGTFDCIGFGLFWSRWSSQLCCRMI